MFKFFDKKGVLVFESEKLLEIEIKAMEYKKENELKVLKIVKDRGSFYKWV